jgi:hypothetical protein
LKIAFYHNKEGFMRSAWLLTVVLTVAVLAAEPAFAQNKWVRGPVTEIGADTLTLTVKGVATTVKVETATRLEVPGGSTAQRAAAKAGKAGVDLRAYVKVGSPVEVQYKEVAGAKVATEIRPIAAADETVAEESGEGAVTGSVVSVTPEMLVIKADGTDMRFPVTPKIRVTGPHGTGTKARALASEGKPTPITEFVAPNDRVVVYYAGQPAAPTMTAVHIVQKAFK